MRGGRNEEEGALPAVGARLERSWALKFVELEKRVCTESGAHNPVC